MLRSRPWESWVRRKELQVRRREAERSRVTGGNWRHQCELMILQIHTNRMYKSEMSRSMYVCVCTYMYVLGLSTDRPRGGDTLSTPGTKENDSFKTAHLKVPCPQKHFRPGQTGVGGHLPWHHLVRKHRSPMNGTRAAGGHTLVESESDEGLRNDGARQEDTGCPRKVLPTAKSRTS